MGRISNLKASVGMLVVLTTLGLVNSVSAVDIYWTNAYAWSVLWRDAENWNPMVVPGATDTAFISPQYCAPPDRGPAVDPMCNVQVFAIHGPRYDSDLDQVMDITGGTIAVVDWRWAKIGTGTARINISGSPNITIGKDWRGVDNGTGILDISGTPTISVADTWRVADKDAWAEIYVSGGSISCGEWQIGDRGSGIVDISGGTINAGVLELPSADGTATLNMADGLLTVYDEFWAPGGDGDGTAIINLRGGTIECGSFEHETPAYSLDIEAGVLIIDWDVRAAVQAEIGTKITNRIL